MSLSLSGPILDRARKHSPIFIETGTYRGGGVLGAALHGFTEIHSIEMSAELHEIARERTAGISGVTLHHGDSAVILPRLLAEMPRAVIFLDGHNMPGDRFSEKVRGDGRQWTLSPLRRELEALRAAPGKDHLIMVDDVDRCGTPELDGLTLAEIKDLLHAVNRQYAFDLIDSSRQFSMLFASPP